MKSQARLTVATALAACLCGLAQAQQLDAEQELKICQSFCAAAKSQCERDRGWAGAATLVGAFALDFIRLAELSTGKSNNSPAGMVETPTLSKSGSSDRWSQAKQPCEAERMECAKGCASPEPKPKTPE